jgi:hypothetical protein
MGCNAKLIKNEQQPGLGITWIAKVALTTREETRACE